MIAARLVKNWPGLVRRQMALRRLFSKKEDGKGKAEGAEHEEDGAHIELEKEFKEDILTRDTLSK